VALVAVMTASTLLLALAVSLALTTTLEVGIAANQRDGIQTLLAADAALERAIADLSVVADWDTVLAGVTASAFNDGGGGVTLPDGSRLETGSETNQLRCGSRLPCSDADMDRSTADRPWGRNNPRWQLYACGSLAQLLPDVVTQPRAYVLVWVADDTSENDAQPLQDGGPPAAPDDANAANPGIGAIRLRARAYGPAGARREIDAVVERDPRLPPSHVRLRLWREIA